MCGVGLLSEQFGADQDFSYQVTGNLSLHQSRFLGRGCDEAVFTEKKGFRVKRGEAIQRIRGLVRISTGKAIQ